jgi:Rieske Fe-S protein
MLTGDSGHGLTTAMAGALLLRDLIGGRDNPWTHVYDPARPIGSALVDWGREVMAFAANVAQRVLPGDGTALHDLKPGEGAVVREDGSDVAAYRDADGKLHLRSAVCTHLGCVVRWNSFDRCWDCPCHGSHYAVDGQVLSGPAVEPLREIPVDATVAAEQRPSRRDVA